MHGLSSDPGMRATTSSTWIKITCDPKMKKRLYLRVLPEKTEDKRNYLESMPWETGLIHNFLFLRCKIMKNTLRSYRGSQSSYQSKARNSARQSLQQKRQPKMAGNSMGPGKRRQLGPHQTTSCPKIWPCYLERFNNLQVQLKMIGEGKATQGLVVASPEEKILELLRL